jgi:hypothetical protein
MDQNEIATRDRFVLQQEQTYLSLNTLGGTSGPKAINSHDFHRNTEAHGLAPIIVCFISSYGLAVLIHINAAAGWPNTIPRLNINESTPRNQIRLLSSLRPLFWKNGNYDVRLGILRVTPAVLGLPGEANHAIAEAIVPVCNSLAQTQGWERGFKRLQVRLWL